MERQKDRGTGGKRSARNNTYLWIGALAITVLCYFAFSITGHLYTYSDNLTVATVIAGMYGDNVFCQYIHPLACVIIHTLFSIFPSADMFATVMHLLLILAVTSLTYMILNALSVRRVRDWKLYEAVLCALFLFSVLFLTLGQNIWGANYTVQTAVLVFAGMIILFRCEGRGKGWVVLGTILVSAGFMFRMEGALLFLPFFALEILAGLITANHKRQKIRSIIKVFTPVVVIVLALMISKHIFYSLEPYASDLKYSDSRTIVVDYPMSIDYPYWLIPEGEEVEGLDSSTYSVIQHWILFDTDRMTGEVLDKAAEIGSHNAFSYSADGLKKALAAMYERVMKMDVHLMVLAVVSILLCIRNMICIRSKWLKTESSLAVLGGFIILLYFTFKGRALIRVWQCVLLAICSVLILAACNDSERRNKIGDVSQETGKAGVISIIFSLLLCVCLYFGIGQVIAHANVHAPVTPLTSRANVDDSAYEETFEGDSLYIWANWYDTIPDYFEKIDKMPTQRVLDHNIPLGDWTYGQEYFRKFLKKINAENPAMALLERPNTYIVEGMEDVVLRYMQAHYGEDIVLTEAGEVRGQKVYRMERSTGSEPLDDKTVLREGE